MFYFANRAHGRRTSIDSEKVRVTIVLPREWETEAGTVNAAYPA
jgi:ribosomal protein L22